MIDLLAAALDVVQIAHDSGTRTRSRPARAAAARA